MSKPESGSLKKILYTLVTLVTILVAPSYVMGVINVRMQTDFGAIDIELLDTVAPNTVANFLNYVNDEDFDGTFFHRSIPGFVLQGGGFIFNPANGPFVGSGVSGIPVDPPIVNEFNLSNVRGTLAMAKAPGNPDSARSEFFFNLTDNPELDSDNGGFTVFGRVLGNGMDIIDVIIALPICRNSVPDLVQPVVCGNFSDVTALNFFESVTNRNLINLNHIGIDNDGDGAIDAQEDKAPNNGDGNNDTVLDSTQQHVASFTGESGGSITLEISASSTIQFVNILRTTFRLTTPDPDGIFNNREFTHGFVDYDIANITPGDNQVTMTVPVILPDECSARDSYFNFGPTPDDATSHWYEFAFDGVTGAEVIGDTVTLHYVDGLRGDSDLAENGVIKVTTGGLATTAGDSDGISDTIENAGPNNGDGNNDGIIDCVQGNVASLVDAVSGSYVTVVAPPAAQLASLAIADGADLLNIINQPGSASLVSGLNFTHGFINFNVNNITSGGSVDIILTLPENETPVTYFKFGPTPDNPVDHLYEFKFDGETGAEFNGNLVTLHFVDGKRGDSDLVEDGVITDPGTPALAAAITSSSGSSGCSMHGNARLQNAGDLWLLIAWISLLGYRLMSRKPCARMFYK